MKIYKRLTNRDADCRNRHKGATVVEFAIILPLFLLLIFGGFEIGHAVMVKHMLEEASRAGCRVAAMNDAQEQDVLDIVDLAMEKAGIKGYEVSIEPNPPSSAAHLDAISVTIKVPYSSVALMGSVKYMSGTTLIGTCVMPAVRDDNNDPNNGTPPANGKKNIKRNNKKSKKNSNDDDDDDDDDD